MSVEAVRFMQGDDQALFNTALAELLLTVNRSGIPFERSPTLYANLITITLASLFKREEAAAQALELLIADLRQMLHLHFAEVEKGMAALQAATESPPPDARH